MLVPREHQPPHDNYVETNRRTGNDKIVGSSRDLQLVRKDGTEVSEMTARELEGDEREHWWKLAVEAYPPYAEYQTKTDRQIPVFIVE